MLRHYWWLPALLIFVAVGIQCEDTSMRNGTRLSKLLLEDYSRNTLPVVPGGLEAELSLALGQFVSISTSAETVEFHGWWRMYWKDPRLSWDSEEWKVSEVSFEPQQIWLPDLTVYEQISEQTAPSIITCYPDGSCQTSVSRTTKIGCSMNIQNFPYDSQKCNMTIGSWSFDGTRLDVVPRKSAAVGDILQDGILPERVPIDLEEYKTFQEFSLVSVKTVWMNQFYNCCPQPYPVLLIEFDLQRSTQTYVGGMVAPLMLVTFIGFFSLLMPAPPSGARPALSVTIMLTTATVYFVASRSTPQSNQSTIIGRMYVAALGTSFALVFVSILTTALNLIQAEDPSQTKHLVAYFKNFDSNGNGQLEKSEFRQALQELGLSTDEQDLMMKWFMTEDDPTINLEQWKAFSTLTAKGDDTAVYHNFVVKGLVCSAIEGRLRRAGQFVGRDHPTVARIEREMGTARESRQENGKREELGSSSQQARSVPVAATETAREPLAASLTFPALSPSIHWNVGPSQYGSPQAMAPGIGTPAQVPPQWVNGIGFGASEWQPPRHQIRTPHKQDDDVRSWSAASGAEPDGYASGTPESDREPSKTRGRAGPASDPLAGCQWPVQLPWSAESLGHVTRKVSRQLNGHGVVQSNPQRVGRELAAGVDRVARWVLPLFFALYLAMEYAGAFSGEAVSGELHRDSEGLVKTRVEFFDYRSPQQAGGGAVACYRNFPKTKTAQNIFRAAERDCKAAQDE